MYSHSSMEAWVTPAENAGIQNFRGSMMFGGHPYRSKRSLRIPDPGTGPACGRPGLQRRIPAPLVRRRRHGGYANRYPIINPGSVRSGQVLIDTIEFHTGHELCRVREGLRVRQPPEVQVSSDSYSITLFAVYIHRRESVDRFATGIDSPWLRISIEHSMALMSGYQLTVVTAMRWL